MMRGTFANVRLRNQMAPGTEGGWTTHQPDGEVMTIYDAAMKYKSEGTAARRHRRQGIRIRIVARLGGEGHAAARREGGDRRELRAHPPQQPREHGRAAAAVPAGRRPPRRSDSPGTNATASGGTKDWRDHQPTPILRRSWTTGAGRLTANGRSRRVGRRRSWWRSATENSP